jgi:Ca2+-binding EF-hand superfamily protein
MKKWSPMLLLLALTSCSAFSNTNLIEVNEVEELIRSADTNNDGGLSAQELAALALKIRDKARQ